MSTDLQVGTNTQVAPVRSDISLPVHDSPQIDLDTGYQIEGSGASKLDEQAILEGKSKGTSSQKYAPKKFWNGEIKKHFNSLSSVQQKAWLDSFRIAEKSYNKIVDDLKTSYAQLDDVAGVLAPYVEEIVGKWGVSPAVYVANLIEADKEATRDPVQYILKIMGAQGLTFSQLGAGVKPLMDETANKVKLAPVLDKISQLEQALLQQQQQVPQEPTVSEVEGKADVMADEIREFYNQTDSSGRELYPGWQNYLNAILPQYLEGENLEDAYNFAAESYKAKIPANETRVTPTPDFLDDTVTSLSERSQQGKEKKMLVNVVEQLKQRYE
jgi:hypothetical protein